MVSSDALERIHNGEPWPYRNAVKQTSIRWRQLVVMVAKLGSFAVDVGKVLHNLFPDARRGCLPSTYARKIPPGDGRERVNLLTWNIASETPKSQQVQPFNSSRDVTARRRMDGAMSVLPNRAAIEAARVAVRILSAY